MLRTLSFVIAIERIKLRMKKKQHVVEEIKPNNILIKKLIFPFLDVFVNCFLTIIYSKIQNRIATYAQVARVKYKSIA